ncbi:MAG: type II toxin-antitoxin system death-on-curing family toxin [Lentisphaerae bacterium]|nr:type II toxin-antitoxin system death-on-curing family toxin [Lentisphaerota bacterium]
MKEPVWIDAADSIAFHGELLAWFGGADGIRDEGLLESALARPRQRFAYGEPTLYEMGAAYAFGIVKNHPFVDGNKRAGFLAATLFLEINGEHFGAPEEEAVIETLRLAAGDATEADYASWLERSCRGE